MEQAGFDSERFGHLFVYLCMAVLLATCMTLLAPASASAATASSGPAPFLADDTTRTGRPLFGLPGVDAQVYALAVDRQRVVCWRRLL